MVTVTLVRHGQVITGFEVTGHAEYEEEGKDIICAGVSAVTQTAVAGLLLHLLHPPQVEREKGWLLCRLPAGMTPAEQEKAQVILTTMEAGLRALEAGYPEYVKIQSRRCETCFP
ncbi:MAG: ribosomal-processing cysteine protease Prp [Syntrophomonadaceae bacterium]|nr:ribosomal-processing cysteine protease Prp [Syntrophomonadaceae bacterium]